MTNRSISLKARRLVDGLLSAPVGQLNEAAWTEDNIIDAILGACDDDKDKLRNGLKALKKGALKKVYCAITDGKCGDDIEVEPGDEDALEEPGEPGAEDLTGSEIGGDKPPGGELLEPGMEEPAPEDGNGEHEFRR